MADTFAAFARDPEALQPVHREAAADEDAGISSFRVQRPFLRRLRAFSEDFAGATHELRGALPDLNAALEPGTRVQRRVPDINKKLGGAFAALEDLTSAPTTNAALRGLTATVTTRSTRSCASSART